MSKITRFYYRLLSILSKKLATFTITIGEKLTFGHPWYDETELNSLSDSYFSFSDLEGHAFNSFLYFNNPELQYPADESDKQNTAIQVTADYGAGGGKDEVNMASLLAQGGFAVYPLTWCPHVELLPESWPETVKWVWSSFEVSLTGSGPPNLHSYGAMKFYTLVCSC